MARRLISRLRGSPFAFPLAALTALAMFWISEASYQDAKSTLDTLGERGIARSEIQALRHGLAEAETGQRGYLITGRAEYLRPYAQAKVTVQRSVDWLRAHYAADGPAAGLIQRIDGLTADKFSELQTTIDMRDRGSTDAWRELVLSNIGKEKMDAIRDLSEQLLTLETERVGKDRESVYQTLLLNRIGVTAMTALSLLALFMYLRQTAALDRQRSQQQDIVQAERDRLEVEVAARTAQLKELALHLQTVREDERRHLARELHDELGALLTAAKLDAARLKSRLGKAATPEVTERMAHLNEALNNGIALKRRIIEDLRPSSLSNLGLVAALDILVREFAARMEIEARCDLHPANLRPSAELTVYRLVQEALTNVAKYASASEVRVSVVARGGEVEITVSDNGVGFDTSVPRLATHGLLGMKFRVESENGAMSIRSAPGQGTSIVAVLPEAETEPEGEALKAPTGQATAGSAAIATAVIALSAPSYGS
jgi:signal transduction histidine kinase